MGKAYVRNRATFCSISRVSKWFICQTQIAVVEVQEFTILPNPEMAGAVLESKMENVPDDVEMISMGNPGCMLQMAIGVKKYGRNQKVVHTVQLLDWAYQKEDGLEGGES